MVATEKVGAGCAQLHQQGQCIEAQVEQMQAAAPCLCAMTRKQPITWPCSNWLAPYSGSVVCHTSSNLGFEIVSYPFHPPGKLTYHRTSGRMAVRRVREKNSAERVLRESIQPGFPVNRGNGVGSPKGQTAGARHTPAVTLSGPGIAVRQHLWKAFVSHTMSVLRGKPPTGQCLHPASRLEGHNLSGS